MNITVVPTMLLEDALPAIESKSCMGRSQTFLTRQRHLIFSYSLCNLLIREKIEVSSSMKIALKVPILYSAHRPSWIFFFT